MPVIKISHHSTNSGSIVSRHQFNTVRYVDNRSNSTAMTVIVLPPTARLPPIKTLSDAPARLLHEAIRYLHSVYNPEIRSSRRINRNSASKGTHLATEQISDASTSRGPNDDAIESEEIRTDAFERAYAVRWLTALVAQKTTTPLHSDDDANACTNPKLDKPDDEAAESNPEEEDLISLEALVQSAAALLAVCAGAASAGTRTRTYVLCGARVQLTDVALRNDDFGSVGVQTWGSACVLAEMIAEAPTRFGLCGTTGDGDDSDATLLSFHDDGDGDGGPQVGAAKTISKRVLELGAGTGLVSLVIGKVLENGRKRGPGPHRAKTVIVASDFYPTALENLRLNIERNFPSDGDDVTGPALARDLSISAHFLDWQDSADPMRPFQLPFDEPFDEVFGADIVYELEHAMWIKACLKRVLRLTGRFHLVIPLRERFMRESATVEHVFPRAEDMHQAMEIKVGPTLCITQKEDITCEAWPDGKGEVEYVHYTIQWAL